MIDQIFKLNIAQLVCSFHSGRTDHVARERHDRRVRDKIFSDQLVALNYYNLIFNITLPPKDHRKIGGSRDVNRYKIIISKIGGKGEEETGEEGEKDINPQNNHTPFFSKKIPIALVIKSKKTINPRR